MTKFLLAIFLLIFGAKLTADSRAFVYNYDFAKYIGQDEEERQEVKEKGKGKYDTEDNMYCHFVFNLSFLSNVVIKASKVSTQQDTYTGFVDKPHTPPPDRLQFVLPFLHFYEYSLYNVF